jgi:hypothetical protein
MSFWQASAWIFQLWIFTHIPKPRREFSKISFHGRGLHHKSAKFRLYDGRWMRAKILRCDLLVLVRNVLAWY